MENDLTILNSQLESLSVNSSSFVKEENIEELSMCNSPSFHDSSAVNSVNSGTPPTNDESFGNTQRKLLNERPIEPIYSPYYYRVMKK